MKRFLAILLALFLPCTALAQGETRFEKLSQAAFDSGKAIESKLTFDFGKAVNFEDAQSLAIKSVLEALEISALRFEGEQDFWKSLNVFLQETSVIDYTIEKKDGMMYEQSNWLAGKTVAFSQEDFLRFFEMAAEKSGVDISGGNFEMKDALENLQAQLAFEEDSMPELMLPGMMGKSAQSVRYTREELMNEIIRLFGLDEMQVEETGAEEEETLLFQTAQTLQEMPEVLENLLPNPMNVTLSRICDETGEAICMRLLVETDREPLLIEWTTADEAIGALYAQGSLSSCNASALLTWQKRADTENPKMTSREKTTIMQITLEEENGDVYFLQASIQCRGKGDERKETVQWTAQADASLNGESLGGIEVEGEEEIRGSGADLKRTLMLDLFRTGLSEKRQKLLGISLVSRAVDAASPVSEQEETICLAEMTDAQLRAWMEEIKAYFPQAALSVLALLPEEAAVYLLEQMD